MFDIFNPPKTIDSLDLSSDLDLLRERLKLCKSIQESEDFERIFSLTLRVLEAADKIGRCKSIMWDCGTTLVREDCVHTHIKESIEDLYCVDFTSYPFKYMNWELLFEERINEFKSMVICGKVYYFVDEVDEV